MAILDDGINVLDGPMVNPQGVAPQGMQAGEEPEGPYDPYNDNIDEVKAYVEAHPDEAPAVLEAEELGKNRVTLIEWLNEKIESEEN